MNIGNLPKLTEWVLDNIKDTDIEFPLTHGKIVENPILHITNNIFDKKYGLTFCQQVWSWEVVKYIDNGTLIGIASASHSVILNRDEPTILKTFHNVNVRGLDLLVYFEMEKENKKLNTPTTLH